MTGVMQPCRTGTCSPQPGLELAGCDVRRLAAEHVAELEARLHEHEKGWRLYPGDGGSATAPSLCALRARWRAADLQGRAESTFPVLFVSAPHIEDEVSGAFPGMPTPVLNATAVLDRLLLVGDFCAPQVPQVTAVMNPATWNQDFVDELVDHLRRHRPVVVGISNLSEGHHYALRVAHLVRRELPQCLVVLGGQHEDAVDAEVYSATSQRVQAMTGRRGGANAAFALTPDQLHLLQPLQTLASASDREVVDVVVTGDAPYALVELLRVVAAVPEPGPAAVKQALGAGAAGFASLPGSGAVAYFDEQEGRIRRLPLSGAVVDADRLPFLEVRHLTQENRFPVFGGRLTAQVLACLGCKYACSFCHESADAFLYGVTKIRQRSARHVVHELELRLEQGFEAVFFDDSTFTQSPRWLSEFLGMLEVRSGPSFEWGCQTTINDVTEAMLSRMAGAGCTYIYFGIESADPTVTAVQKVLQLGVTAAGTTWAERFREVARWCRSAGIRVGTSLQFGLGEDVEQRVATLRLVAEMHQDGCIPDECVALNVNSPYPGTRQWIDLLRRGDQLPDYRARLRRHPAFETAHQFSSLDSTEIEELYALARQVLGAALHSESR